MRGFKTGGRSESRRPRHSFRYNGLSTRLRLPAKNTARIALLRYWLLGEANATGQDPPVKSPTVGLYIRITDRNGNRHYERLKERSPQVCGPKDNYALLYYKDGKTKWEQVAKTITRLSG